MAIRFPSPWMSAGAGLAGGVTEGLALGLQNAHQKKQEEQQRQHQAMQLLMGFSKVAEQDPETARALETQIAPMFEKLSGKPWQPMKIPTEQDRMARATATEKAWEAQGFSRPEAMAMMGVTAPRASSAMPYMEQDDDGNWRVIAGPGGQPGRPWQERAQDPYRHGGFFGTPEGGYGFYTPDNPPPPGYLPPSKAPSIGKPPKEGKPPQPRLIRSTADQRKAWDAAQGVIEDPKSTPEQRAKATEVLTGAGGAVGETSEKVETTPAWKFPSIGLGSRSYEDRKKPKVTKMPPTERWVTPPGSGGGGGGVPDEVMTRRGFVRGPDGKWMKPKKEEEPEE